MNAERVTTAEQHDKGDGVGDSQRQLRVAHENERDDNREGRNKAQQAKSQRTFPIALRQACAPGRLRQEL